MTMHSVVLVIWELLYSQNKPIERTIGSNKNALRAPGELVAQRVVGAFGCRQAAAPRLVSHHAASALPDGRDGFERMHVVDARVEADLVQTHDACRTRTVSNNIVSCVILPKSTDYGYNALSILFGIFIVHEKMLILTLLVVQQQPAAHNWLWSCGVYA